jgi:ubiquinone/menaquinone biosynthesis C-methylase UbiE
VDFLVARLELRPGRTVLDLAAGTGKLTRLLVPSGATVVAVEPAAGMRAELECAVPGVDVRSGTAEAIPLPSESVDAVTVAQAFHWFDLDRAVPEIRRVLRRGGTLALLWNEWDPADPAAAAVDEVVEPLRPARIPPRRWREQLDESPLFGVLEHHRFPYEETLPLADAVQREATTSAVASLGDDERAAVLARIHAALEPFGDPVRWRCWTDVFVAEAQ